MKKSERWNRSDLATIFCLVTWLRTTSLCSLCFSLCNAYQKTFWQFQLTFLKTIQRCEQSVSLFLRVNSALALFRSSLIKKKFKLCVLTHISQSINLQLTYNRCPKLYVLAYILFTKLSISLNNLRLKNNIIIMICSEIKSAKFLGRNPIK